MRLIVASAERSNPQAAAPHYYSLLEFFRARNVRVAGMTTPTTAVETIDR
jgi:hypothetical protein